MYKGLRLNKADCQSTEEPVTFNSIERERERMVQCMHYSGGENSDITIVIERIILSISIERMILIKFSSLIILSISIERTILSITIVIERMVHALHHIILIIGCTKG